MQSSPSYGAIPPYETAIVFTLRDQPLGAGFESVAVHVLGYVTGTLYEWRKRESSPEAGARIREVGRESAGKQTRSTVHARSRTPRASPPSLHSRADLLA